MNEVRLFKSAVSARMHEHWLAVPARVRQNLWAMPGRIMYNCLSASKNKGQWIGCVQ